MTVIKKIKMSGFKSFANPIELVFGGDFNVCIGPNGSGKSNIMDAMTFVFGKISAKSMRAEKSANLIYNGGKKGKPAKSAEVSIHFDNSKRTFPIEANTVVISRQIKEKGISKYRINNEVRTRQQVLDLLNTAQIDPDGHNIILQGDIVRFMEMPSDQRREIIEEVSGISIYEDKKQKAMNELDKVQVRLSEAEIILKERETHLKELKKDRDQALRFKDLEDKIKSNKATFLNMKIKDKEKKRDEIETKIKDQEKGINKINERIQKLRSKVDENKEKLNKISDLIEQKGEKEQIKLQKDIEDLKTDAAKNEERINGCQTEIKRIKSRKEQLKLDSKETGVRIKELLKEQNSLKANKNNLVKEQEQLEKSITTFRKKHGISDIEEIEDTIDKLGEEIEENQSKNNRLYEERQELIREKDRIELLTQNVEKEIENLSSLDIKNKSNIELLKQRKRNFKETTLELNKRLNEDSNFSVQLSKARSNLINNQEVLGRLRAKHAGIKETLLQNTAVNKILSLKNKIGGIYGTVSELGTTDQRYSKALEVAAGPRIRSIVVDSDSTAARCIKILKETKSGVATFLPLNKIKPRVTSSELKKLSESTHGLAIDLVKFDKKLSNVFSYVFGTTLVVDNIERARRIGVGKARMVTLEGDLIEPSGAMIGGFRRKTPGLSFTEKTTAAQLNNIETDILRLRKAIDLLSNKKIENESNIIKLREEKALLEVDIIKIENVMESKNDPSELKSNKRALIQETKDISLKLREFESKISQTNRLIDNLKDKKIKERSGKTKSKELSSLNRLGQQKQELREEIIRLEGEINNINNQINILSPESKNVEKILKQQEKETIDFTEEINKLSSLLKKQSLNLKDKEKKQKTFYADYKNLFSRRNKLNEEVQKQEISFTKEEARIREIQGRINNISLDKAKVVSELEGLNLEFKEFEDVSLRKGITLEKLNFEISNFEKLVSQMGNINMRALEIYEGIEHEYAGLLNKASKLKVEKEDVLNLMYEIESKKKGIFMDTFKEINNNFRRNFSHLSSKGEASLEIEDPEDPFKEGVMIKVRLTGNKFMDIKSLSGGEKTMTALAFIFAIQEHNPASFYLLDEVDAALDKHNSEKLSKLIKNYSKKAQYIVISHNDALITEADQIYGISMQSNGISKVVSLKV